ncbi:OsmC family protein [Dyadobacter sp.]|uniref:OsmC family protein n=1 Tax=Dyadobacter sp. TaxID=1914288 RepID=UPI003F7023F2
MKISAKLKNSFNEHYLEVATNGATRNVQIPPKPTGFGSAVNGGEMLLLALATCFCNDIYREAAKKNIAISGVEVNCTADFGAEGEPGSNFQYTVQVTSDAPKNVIAELIEHTNRIAEIHNTLRIGTAVTLVNS